MHSASPETQRQKRFKVPHPNHQEQKPMTFSPAQTSSTLRLQGVPGGGFDHCGLATPSTATRVFEGKLVCFVPSIRSLCRAAGSCSGLQALKFCLRVLRLQGIFP